MKTQHSGPKWDAAKTILREVYSSGNLFQETEKSQTT